MEQSADLFGFAASILGPLVVLELVARPRRMEWRVALLILTCFVGLTGSTFLYVLDQQLRDPLFEYEAGFPHTDSPMGWVLAVVVMWMPLIVYTLGRAARSKRWL